MGGNKPRFCGPLLASRRSKATLRKSKVIAHQSEKDRRLCAEEFVNVFPGLDSQCCRFSSASFSYHELCLHLLLEIESSYAGLKSTPIASNTSVWVARVTAFHPDVIVAAHSVVVEVPDIHLQVRVDPVAGVHCIQVAPLHCKWKIGKCAGGAV